MGDCITTISLSTLSSSRSESRSLSLSNGSECTLVRGGVRRMASAACGCAGGGSGGAGWLWCNVLIEGKHIIGIRARYTIQTEVQTHREVRHGHRLSAQGQHNAQRCGLLRPPFFSPVCSRRLAAAAAGAGAAAAAAVPRGATQILHNTSKNDATDTKKKKARRQQQPQQLQQLPIKQPNKRPYRWQQPLGPVLTQAHGIVTVGLLRLLRRR